MRIQIHSPGIRNDLFRIRLRNYRDPDPTHCLWAYLKIILEKNTLYRVPVINLKKESTKYLQYYYYRLPVFCIFYLTLQYSSPESSGLKIRNKILIYLLFHYCWIRIRIK